MIANTTLQLSRRRMVVQLASLVDLLFVILFLQYMQLRVASQRQAVASQLQAVGERELRTRAEQAAKSAEEKEKSALAVKETAMAQVDKLVRLRDNNQRLNDEIKALNKQLAELREKTQDADKRIIEEEKRADAERQDLAKIVQGMLGVDIGPALKNAPQKDIGALKRQWEELEEASPGAIVQHLRKTAEMQKLCSIWEVHVNEDGTVRLRFGDAPWTFRPKNADDFAQQVYDKSKETGEPKSLVLVLETFGNAQLATRNNVKKGLKIAADLLKAQWPGKRFEIAIPRFSAAPPP